MANAIRTNGFRPVKHLSGAPYNGAVNKYVLLAADGTDTFVGDILTLSGDADALGIASVEQATGSSIPVGVAMSFEPIATNLESNYRVGGVLQYVYVADSPDLIMEAQEDADTTELEGTMVGMNVIPIVGSGSTTTGQSGMEVDSTSQASTATHMLHFVGFSQRVDNEVGVDRAKCLVSWNVHQHGSVGTLGFDVT